MFSEPCQPVIASAQAVCNTSEAQISWHPAPGLVNYTVVVAGNLGYASIHNTSQNLLLAAFPCGQVYNVTVQGRGAQCDSLPSTAAFFKAGTISKLISEIKNKHWSSGCTLNCALIPQLLVFPVTSRLMYSVSLIGGQSAGGPVMVPNLTLPWQQAMTDIGTCVSPTPPPALGVTCTVEKNTLLW